MRCVTAHRFPYKIVTPPDQQQIRPLHRHLGNRGKPGSATAAQNQPLLADREERPSWDPALLDTPSGIHI
jgi:hypothetical protein